ncbi:MAG: cell division ATP-binding protein FtsE [Bacteroidetes bacterium CG12_big_fil_rev_8_21_14_0_65_60_17]|nr:MAG: cell division ATP-binding protein FtsE [Bacteroidetes bacterium CG12_big_fil_rev_8_21_14_0_65_60_17]
MIEFRDVSIAWPLPDGGQKPVLEDVSFRITRGEFVYLVGPTGSGKSSLLKLLYRDAKPTSGEVRIADFTWDGRVAGDTPYLRRAIGIVFQDFQLLPDRNVFDNVAFALYVTGKSGKEVKNRVLQVLARVGLTPKQRRFPHELSGGEQQRVVIARAIVNEPWVVLADEPTGNLDPGVASDIQKVLVGLNQQGMTVIMATHDYRLVRRWPSRTLAVLNRRIVEVDPASLKG